MPKKLFRITDPYTEKQYKQVRTVLRAFDESTLIVYQSNWYMTIACLDRDIAVYVKAKLQVRGKWNMEIRPGNKNKVRHYIRLQFHRE